MTEDISSLANVAACRDTPLRSSEPHPTRVPDFLYIGTSKAGSTWIYHLLALHSQVYLAPGKGLYYFDGHFDRGRDWYLSHFDDAGDRNVAGEISHSYLFSQEACARIFEMNPRMKLIVSLREPVERAYSAYLDGVKNGQIDVDFEQALASIPSLIDRGCYATHLGPYVERFGRASVHVALFDELVFDPQSFADKLFAFLEVEPMALPAKATEKMMPAARPRSQQMVRLAKDMSALGKRLGLRRLRGRLKRSRLVRNLLYRQFTDEDKPRMNPETRRMLCGRFREEVQSLDALAGTDCAALWGYD